MKITASAISLTVADPEASARFLEQTFGFEREMAADGFWSLTRPDIGFNVIYLRAGLPTFKPRERATRTADGLLIVLVAVDNVVGGVVPRTSAVMPAAFARALETAMNAALAAAGLATSVAVGLDSASHLQFTPTGHQIVLSFADAIVAEATGGRIALSTPQVRLTQAAGQSAIPVDRRLDVSTRYVDPAFQEIGITSTPTRFDYTGVTTDPIDFTMLVDGAEVRVLMAPGSSFTTLDSFVAALQLAVNSALAASSRGAMDADADGIPDVKVCRSTIDPSATDPCSGTGARLVLRADSGAVGQLSIDVPLVLAGGGLNGAVSELGLEPAASETRRARSTTFFLENVSLNGIFEVVVPHVTATANFGFLAVSAEGSGALPTSSDQDRLIDLAISLSLKNPLVASTDPLTDRISLGVLASAMSDGKFLYDPAATGGTAADPATGFVEGTVSGGIGAALQIKPEGALSGLADTLNASLSIVAQSSDWLTDPPFDLCTATTTTGCIDVTFVGPDFDAVLDRFRHAGLRHDHRGAAADRRVLADNGRLGRQQRGGLDPGHQAPARRTQPLRAARHRARRRRQARRGARQPGRRDPGPQQHLRRRRSASRSAPERSRPHQRHGRARRAPGRDDLQRHRRDVPDRLHLGCNGAVDGPIAFNATAAVVKAALEELDAIDDVTVDKVGNDLADHVRRDARPHRRRGAGRRQPQARRLPHARLQPATSELNFDLDLPISTQVSRPFNLKLTDISGELPGLLAGIADALVGVSASGNLAVDATANLRLRLGLDLSGPDRAFFLRTGPSGTNLHLTAGATAAETSRSRLGSGRSGCSSRVAPPASAASWTSTCSTPTATGGSCSWATAAAASRATSAGSARS